MDEPLAFCEFEGGIFYPWDTKQLGHRRPMRIHAIFFEDGAIFDTQNGWWKCGDLARYTGNDLAEDMYHIRHCLQEEYWKRDGYKQYDRADDWAA